MIQIQDDVNASTNPNSSPSMPPVSSYVPPAPVSTAAPTQAPAPDQVKKDNSAEIDRLLAELDKLSKELDQAPASQADVVPAATPTPVATPNPAPTDLASALPDGSTQSPSMTPAVSEEKTEEKFDFDSFLSDLEKKIDEEAAKNQAAGQPVASSDLSSDAAATNEAEDFRKNRSTPNLDSADSASEMAGEDTSAEPSQPAVSGESTTTNDSEDLKSQNIFDMLGLAKISDAEKNQFLDELEMMIWDDFVVHDLELLLTSEEYGQARQLLDDQSKSEDERKENLVVFLEKLIPDLDEVLYEKALELKSEMMAERLSKLKETTDPAISDKVKKAEDLISENRWRSAVSLLNSL